MIKTSVSLLAVIVVLVLGFFVVTGEKKNDTVYHIGVLAGHTYFLPVIDGFKEQMTKLGYVEGVNVMYDIQEAPTPVGNQNIAQKFVDAQVDLILVFPTEASLEVKEVTKDTGIPVISTAVAVEGTDLVESLKSPGGNITGVVYPVSAIVAKRLEILHAVAPEVKRILIPYLKDYPTVPVGLAAAKSTATKLGIQIQELPVTSPEHLETSLPQVRASDIDAVLFIPEPVAVIPAFSGQLYLFAHTHNIPLVGSEIFDKDTSPVFSLIPNIVEMGQLAAPLADSIFKGIAPGTIPFATPELVFELNYRVAKALGLSVSESLLNTADRIVR